MDHIGVQLKAGLTEGDTMMARYHGGFGDGSAKVLSIDSTNQIIYMKGTPVHMMISWSHLSNTDKDIFKREQVPTTHITGTRHEKHHRYTTSIHTSVLENTQSTMSVDLS